jgi:diguanylate cyclase (GGDEF)-like protein
VAEAENETMQEDHRVTTTRRALVVDDDVMVRLLTREALEGLGVMVEEASDGLEAVTRFWERPFDLVLLDLRMPHKDGFAACSELKALPGGQEATVVVITGLDDHTSIRKACELGAADFITKPLNWPILVQRLRYILRAQEASRELRDSEARLSEAQRIAKLGSWEWDIASGVAQWSHQTFRILGKDPATFPPSYSALLESVHPEDRASVTQALVEAVQKSGAFAIDHRVIGNDGSVTVVHSQGFVVVDDLGKPARVRSVMQDITQRKRNEERIHRLAYYDELTGLPNRDLFFQHAKSMIAGAERDATKVALVFLDLDRFKRINDSLGHSAGDELLRAITSRFTNVVRRSDVIGKWDREEAAPSPLARVGADEFAILVRGLRRAESAGNFAQRLLEDLSEPFDSFGQEIFLTASIGIALYPNDADEVDGLFKHADVALEHAKRAGGNCFRFFASAMNAKARERLSLETRLNRALERNELSVYFQPQTSISTGQLMGLEALLRWFPADRPPISPAEFIPVAEETGLIAPIGAWVLDTVCAQLAAWRRDGHRTVPVAINLSARQFDERDLARNVRSALDSNGIEPSSIELELTETVIMRDAEETRRRLELLKGTGVRLAVDDFGTGYSSMSYLKRFPLDTLKIDRIFIKDLSVSAVDADIVKAIIALAKSLRLTTIAEGVENDAQRAMLAKLGCDWCQGFLVSPAVAASEIASLLPADRAVAV